MKPTKGLNRDHPVQEQPPQTIVYGKNGTVNARTNAIQNEKGLRDLGILLPYTHIGTIEGDIPVVFSTDNINSAIGYIDLEELKYVPVLDDAVLSYKLKFSTSCPIHGEIRKNYRDIYEIVWTDNLNPIRYLQFGNIPENINGYNLFPESYAPELDINVVGGGELILGTYYVAVKYSKDDTVTTRFFEPSKPIFTYNLWTNEREKSTGKALQINISNIDTSWDAVTVGIIQKVEGITTAVEMPRRRIAGDSISILYTGTEGTEITLEELLIPSIVYSKGKTMTQLHNTLYIGNVATKKGALKGLQKYANQIKIKHVSKTVDLFDDEVVSGKLRTFRHGEVYAFYIVYLMGSERSEAYHIPGIPVSDAARQMPSYGRDQKIDAMLYQSEFAGQENTDYTGMWENTSETYPDIEDFAPLNGSEDLRGKKVRHHRMPFMQDYRNLTGANNVRTYPMIGIQLENVTIPIELSSIITGYEVFYAKRKYSESTVPLQGFLTYTAKAGFYHMRMFTGGNFHSRMSRTQNESTVEGRRLYITPDIAKVTGLELLYNKPLLSKIYLRVARTVNSRIDGNNSERFKSNWGLDLTRTDLTSCQYPKIVLGVDSHEYILNNQKTSRGDVDNIKSQDGLLVRFSNHNQLMYNVGENVGNATNLHDNKDPRTPGSENVAIVDVCTIKENVYTPFYAQDLVKTDKVLNIGEYAEIFGGDCFLSDVSLYSTGCVNSLDRFVTRQPQGVDSLNKHSYDTFREDFYWGNRGIKIGRYYAEICSLNSFQRSTTSSKFTRFPRSHYSYMFSDECNRNEANNVIILAKDANSVADMIHGETPVDYYDKSSGQYPTIIARSNARQTGDREDSWRTFNSLDFYEADKSMGDIEVLQSQEDSLLIHHKRAIFRTNDKTAISGDILDYTLGSGDIFQYPPKMLQDSKTGFGGIVNLTHSKKTDIGYIFNDSEAGGWYSVNGAKIDLISNDMNIFLMSYSKLKSHNAFTGNGVCMGFDPLLKRLMVTVKNIEISDEEERENFVSGFIPTPEFISKLTEGVSLVELNGKIVRFMGESTGCAVGNPPTINDASFSIRELSPSGTLVGTMQYTSDSSSVFSILTGNVNNSFSITNRGEIRVNIPNILMSITPNFYLIIGITNEDGIASATAQITVTPATLDPIVEDKTINVVEGIKSDTIIGEVTASDPMGLPLTVTIENQSVPNTVRLEGLNIIVSDETVFDSEINPFILITIKAYNGNTFSFGTISIIVLAYVNPLIDRTDILEGMIGLSQSTKLEYLKDPNWDYDVSEEGEKEYPEFEYIRESGSTNTIVNTVTETVSFLPEKDMQTTVFSVRSIDTGALGKHTFNVIGYPDMSYVLIQFGLPNVSEFGIEQYRIFANCITPDIPLTGQSVGSVSGDLDFLTGSAIHVDGSMMTASLRGGGALMEVNAQLMIDTPILMQNLSVEELTFNIYGSCTKSDLLLQNILSVTIFDSSFEYNSSTRQFFMPGIVVVPEFVTTIGNVSDNHVSPSLIGRLHIVYKPTLKIITFEKI